MQPAISVQNVSKSYLIGHQKTGDLRNTLANLRQKLRPTEKEEFWALRDISFDVQPGEAVGIIGRNGAGKSTLLKILSRITEPTTGRIEINGRVSSLLEVGTGFHPELTGRENIFLNGTILGMRRAEIKAKFDEIVAFSGVEKFIDTPVKHYSSGMKVRLAFSVAAHLEPEILIVDEVLAVGDAEFQKKCLGKMDEVSKNEGRTILFVSHNMGAVQSLCSKGILLQSGIVKKIDTAVEIVSTYLESVSSNTIESVDVQRTGKGDVRITEFSFYDRNQRQIHELISGQFVKIRIRYESTLLKLNSLVIGITISNSSDSFLTVLNNKMSNYSFNNIEGSGFIECEIEKLPLMNGLHILSLNLYADEQPQDILSSAIKINVINSDYYESGFPNAHGRQGIYINQKWEIGIN